MLRINTISKVQLLFPLLLALVSYFNHYFIGLFDQADSFEFISLAVIVTQYYLYWCMFPILNQRIGNTTLKNVNEKNSERYRVLSLVVCFLFSAVVISVVVKLILKLYFIYAFNNPPIINWLHFTVYGLLGLLNGGMVLAVRLYLHSQANYQKQKLQLSKMAQENERAQLSLLQAQVDPHFLFNNLNTLYSLINQDTKVASSYLLHLSSYLRKGFDQASTPLIPLTRELMELEHYLEILKIRFADCFDIVINEECHELSSNIPPLSLVELIENAVKHNEVDKKCPLLITITIFADSVEVKNNCNKKIVNNSNGVGLANLNKRLNLLTNKSLTIKENLEEFIVTVPLISKTAVGSLV